MNNIMSLTDTVCCGCGVCVKKCPKNVLTLRADREGFLYPAMHDPDLCINCGVCLISCPANQRKLSVPICFDNPKYVYHPDSDTCKASASGGVAAGLYRSVIRQNGVGFGVSYTKNFTDAEYIRVDKIEDIYELLGSKYIKARENGFYDSVKRSLNDNVMTLAIGLPCEIAALKSYLGKDYDNLYTCELICHGPTSHVVLSETIKMMEKNENSRVVALNQRAKKPYWKPYYMDVIFDNGKEVCFPFVDSDFEKAFQIMKRPSCNSCVFKDGQTCGDMIIGDFHGARKQTAEYNEFGVSICFPCTEKGMKLIEMLRNEGFVIGEADKNRAMGNRALHEPIPRMSVRSRFVKRLLSKGLNTAANDMLVKFHLKKRKITKKIRARLKLGK